MSLCHYEQYEVTTHPSSIPYFYDGPGTPCYNGNVSSMKWKNGNSTKKRGYKFTYDGVNRLAQAMYGEGDALTTYVGRFREVLGYDAHGNVTSIARYRRITSSSYGLMDYNQDHLGNNREVVDSAGTVKQVTNYYPFGAPYADPAAVMNASLQPYKYNGKELDRMHGLDTYDYGARQYDPILGRWDRIDPLCEKYYSVSPYAYCANNPVNMIDPNGMDGIATIDYENGTIVISQTFYYNRNSEDLMNDAIVTDKEINNFHNGHKIIPSEISLLSQNGFSSKEWIVNDGSIDWSVSFVYEFIPLESDDEVKKALDSNPAANALCYNKDLKINGEWDPLTRKLTLGFNRGGLGPERGSTLFHEVGHSWGLPHENEMPQSPIYEKANEDGDGIMSYGNNRTIKQYEVEYGVRRILKDVLANHPSSIELHIKTGNEKKY